MVSENLLDPSAELDFSEDGFQDQGVTVLITDAQPIEHNGNVSMEITFETTVLESGTEFDREIKERFWLDHSNPKASSIGRAQYKRLGVIALEKEAFAASALIGARLVAKAYDRDGFVHLKNFSAVK